MANTLVREWLKRSNRNWTSFKSQDIRPVFNNISALIEVVKYGSKIFTEPDLKKKGKDKGKAKIYVAALNNIFTAMKGLRIFERFGFDLPPQTKTAPAVVVQDYCEWLFHPDYYDWLNLENGHPLTDYHPPKELLSLLENSLDIELE
ncbi:MAG: hypothetical protein ABIQ88_09220 [Chitinophagaceae bacterium]